MWWVWTSLTSGLEESSREAGVSSGSLFRHSQSVVSNSLRPHGLYPTKFLCPWGFSGQEYWSGLPCPPPRDLPNTGIESWSLVLQADSLPSGASLVTQMVKHLPAMRETRVWSLSWEDPLEKEGQPSPVFLPGESHGQRGLVGYSPWCHKELAITEWLTHSCYIIDILLKTLHKLLHLTFFLLCGNCHFTNKNLKFKELK